MIEFKKQYTELLPYDKQKYLDYFDDEQAPSINWYGVSFQLEKFDLLQALQFGEVRDFNLDKSIDILQAAFNALLSRLDEGQAWVVSHDDKDMAWFLRDQDNLSSLRATFRNNRIDNSYQGALLCFKEDLFRLSRDLVSYPYMLSYKDLDVSHSKLPILIKVTGHLTIDLLSTD